MIKQEEWRLALKACNAALVKSPDHPKALYRRAVALCGLGRHQEAEGDLIGLVRREPKNKEARRQLSTARQTIKDANERKFVSAKTRSIQNAQEW